MQTLPSLDKLAQASLPAIAHWEGRHYIVVYEVRRNRVIVADPAIGQRSLTRTQFLTGWTGYTLLLQPTALFKEADEAKQSFFSDIFLKMFRRANDCEKLAKWVLALETWG